MLAEFVEQRQRPAEASYAGSAPRSSSAHTSAPAPATADSEVVKSTRNHMQVATEPPDKKDGPAELLTIALLGKQGRY